MTSGGARARGGRAPDPNAIRRDRHYADDEWTTLPPNRSGPPPKWPLVTPTERELALWKREWQRPQAVVWEARGQELEVALYVQAVAISEGSTSPTYRTVVLRFLEDLGISQSGLARNRWKIAPSTAPAAERRPATTDTGSAKARLKLVG